MKGKGARRRWAHAAASGTTRADIAQRRRITFEETPHVCEEDEHARKALLLVSRYGRQAWNAGPHKTGEAGRAKASQVSAESRSGVHMTDLSGGSCAISGSVSLSMRPSGIWSKMVGGITARERNV